MMDSFLAFIPPQSLKNYKWSKSKYFMSRCSHTTTTFVPWYLSLYQSNHYIIYKYVLYDIIIWSTWKCITNVTDSNNAASAWAVNTFLNLIAAFRFLFFTGRLQVLLTNTTNYLVIINSWIFKTIIIRKHFFFFVELIATDVLSYNSFLVCISY